LAQFSPALKVFSCKSCGITDVQKMAFFGLSNLHRLDLRGEFVAKSLNQISANDILPSSPD